MRRQRTYPWMILARGIKNRKPSTHYYPVVTFAREIAEDDARAVRDFMSQKWPGYQWLLTNREDWRSCYNSGPGAKASWIPGSGWQRADEIPTPQPA